MSVKGIKKVLKGVLKYRQTVKNPMVEQLKNVRKVREFMKSCSVNERK